jgi:glutamyl-tRNA reductase
MLIEEEVVRFRKRVQGLDAVPTIVALQERVEQIRRAEIERLRGRMGTLSPEQQATIENLTRSIVNKILHQPIATLKNAAGDRTIAELIRTVFGVEEARNDEAIASTDDVSQAPSIPKPRKAGAREEESLAEEIAARKSSATR